MTVANAQQIDEWNGNSGARWVEHQEWLDRRLAAFGAAALAAAAPRAGESVLDIGCGAGATTLELARAVAPSGRVTGIDISEPLLARARERARAGAGAGGLAADFVAADASRHAFPEGSFDLLFSRFGVMFFDDPVAAFRHLHSLLASTGRLAFVAWRAVAENDWFRLPLKAAFTVLPPQPRPEPFAPGPFAFADRARVDAILAEAGFKDVGFAPFDAPMLQGAGNDAVDTVMGEILRVGPIARLLADAPDATARQAEDCIRTALAARQADGRLVLSGGAWIVTARA